MNCAGLIFDDSKHYIDHLAPFCALMNWPLIVCEPDVADLVRTYYPDVVLVERDLLDIDLPNLIVSCETPILLRASIPQWKGKSLWLPHGNSDKGWKSSYFECSLRPTDTALVYGQKMVDFMQEKKLAPTYIRVGNFRAQYWKQRRGFYESFLPKTQNNYLYAPTWEDVEGNGSFWHAFPQLAKNLPTSATLIVKLHPNTFRQQKIEIEILRGRWQQKENICFLEEFPPIYPLLSRCDAYIGDMSSIGYDFLYFNRPMYFLNPQKRDPLNDKGLYLFRCGHQIDPESFLFNLGRDYLGMLRQEIYQYTFDSCPDWTQLSKDLIGRFSL